MVVDLSDVIPFCTWLLGAGWNEGWLFGPLPLLVFLALAAAGLVWLVARVRKGESVTGRSAALAVSGIIAASGVLVLAGAITWNLLSKETKSELQTTVLNAFSRLLGAEWSQGALYQWFVVVFFAGLVLFIASWLVAALRRGPIEALVSVGQSAGDLFLDVVRISPRRVWALAYLAIKESIRRRVVVVFAVFILLLLFAGWYLDPQSINLARLYLDFVLTATSYLVLLLALFLSVLSLPADIKNHTIYTVVTKPVRTSEIVLGRMVGFMAVATLLLAPMGVISYVFVQRGLAHTHELSAEDLRPAEGGAAGQASGLQGLTSRVHHHRHRVAIAPSGREGRVQMEQGHTHELTIDKSGATPVYHVGAAEGMLQARVPVYGTLVFRDRTGQPAAKGINVGDEWTYRGFVEGGTLSAAVWTFHGITEERFPKGLPVELAIEVFRTHKGEIERGVLGILSVRNPKTGKKVEVRNFESKEFRIDVQEIPRKLPTPEGATLDLFKDIVSDGDIEVVLQCAEPMQYFGAAQGDLYLRARDASFAWNFAKGYTGIWLQTALVVALGVMFSTFLSGPVAMLATLGTLIGGFFSDFMFRLATGQTFGGGPVESAIRMLTQQNVTSEMEPGLRTNVAQTLDQGLEFLLRLLASILPDFGRFNFSEFVACGFNVPGDTLLSYTFRALGFVVPVFVVAYLCLKNREVAQ